MRTKPRLFLVAACVALVQGCATQFSTREAGVAETSGPTPVLQFQSNSIEPLTILAPELLEPGDILLSAEPTVVSASIRLMTLAPVSHAAVYVGDSQVVDAMRWGVRTRELDQLLDEAAVVLVLRYPELTTEQAADITEYAVGKSGAGFNFLGITLQVPFSIARRLCELPLLPAAIRDACLRSIGLLHHLSASERRLFCSQLVLQAYRHAGVLVTRADARIVSPADILHMREGDVSSLNIPRQLRYLGHLKDQRRPVTTLASRD